MTVEKIRNRMSIEDIERYAEDMRRFAKDSMKSDKSDYYLGRMHSAKMIRDYCRNGRKNEYAMMANRLRRNGAKTSES